MSNIKTELVIFNQYRERIAAAYALDTDDEAVVDTASGETKLEDEIAKLIREANVAEAQAQGIRCLIARLEARHDRLGIKRDKLRALAKEIMGESGMKRVSAPDFTASISAGKPPLVVTREPDEFDAHVNKKVALSWDRAALRSGLESGMAYDFAYLGNQEPILRVTTK